MNPQKRSKTTRKRANPVMFTLRKSLKPSYVFTTAHRLIATYHLLEPSSSAAYDDLINAAGRERDFATVRHRLIERYAKGFFTTNKTFRFISTDLSVINDVLKTLSGLDEGYGRKQAYDSLVSSLCKMDLTGGALKVAEAAAAVGGKYSSDASTFHPILGTLTRKKNFFEAWRVIEIMESKSIKRDVTCYNFFLTSYSVIVDLKSCVVVLKKMAEDGLKADARTYDALVLGACNASKMDGAMAILRKMLEEGVEAMHSTHAHVINNLVRLDYRAQAVKFVMSFEGKDKILDAHNYGLLATRLVSKKKVDEARWVIQEMVKRNLHMSEELKKINDRLKLI